MKQELEELKVEKQRETDPWKVQEIKRKERQIEEELKEHEKEHSFQNMIELQGILASAFKSQADSLSNLLAAKFGLKQEGQEPGHANDSHLDIRV